MTKHSATPVETKQQCSLHMPQSTLMWRMLTMGCFLWNAEMNKQNKKDKQTKYASYRQAVITGIMENEVSAVFNSLQRFPVAKLHNTTRRQKVHSNEIEQNLPTSVSSNSHYLEQGNHSRTRGNYERTGHKNLSSLTQIMPNCN